MDFNVYFGNSNSQQKNLCLQCNKIYQLRSEVTGKKTSFCLGFRETLEDDGKFQQYFSASCNTCAHFHPQNPI